MAVSARTVHTQCIQAFPATQNKLLVSFGRWRFGQHFCTCLILLGTSFSDNVSQQITYATIEAKWFVTCMLKKMPCLQSSGQGHRQIVCLALIPKACLCPMQLTCRSGCSIQFWSSTTAAASWLVACKSITYSKHPASAKYCGHTGSIHPPISLLTAPIHQFRSCWSIERKLCVM